MPKKQFDKPVLEYEQQLDQLIQRGLDCSERLQALHHLKHLNYYRLSGYWRPFKSAPDKDQFKADVNFEAILNLYDFDRKLRLLVMDAIERVEVSMRTGWAYQLAHRYGSHAHLDPTIFNEPKKNWNYCEHLNKLKEDTNRSREAFIKHHDKYDEPLPPVWVSVEIMSLGQLSRWYANLRHKAVGNAVAHRYDMDEIHLCSFLHHLTTIRNLCAHHGRLWDRKVTLTFKLPDHRPDILVSSLNHDCDARKRIYNTLTVLAWLMDCISPDHGWKQQLKTLLEQHRIDTQFMGFPADFADFPIWSATWAGNEIPDVPEGQGEQNSGGAVASGG